MVRDYVISRRTFAQVASAALMFSRMPRGNKIPRIAVLSTTYHVRSHSDNFVTRFLEGYWINQKYHRSPCKVISLYRDQVDPADVSCRLSMAYDFKIYPTIFDALTLGTGKLAVDGVLLIAEHGDYPVSEKLQKHYPRYEFMRQVVDVFEKSRRSVPVFVDKHLSHDWIQARWMYDASSRLGFPLMAGSSLPVTFRRPELDVPLGTRFGEALAVGPGWVEDGGIFHVLEMLQCFVERRQGGETGIRSVCHLEGDAVWEAQRQGLWSKELLAAALSRGETVVPGPIEDLVKDPVVCLLEYRDGFRASALMLGGKVSEYLVSFRVQDEEQIHSTLCYIPIENSNNFSPLVDSIARMFLNGRMDFPIERTLLTTGALAFLMESRHQGHNRLTTPELAISYRAPERSYFARGEGS